MKYLEQSKELCFQLPVLFGLDLFAVQPYFITGGIASRLNAFIVSLFLKFFGMVKVFLTNNYQFS